MNQVALLSLLLIATSGCGMAGRFCHSNVPLEQSLNTARHSERDGNLQYASQVYRQVLVTDPNNAVAHHRLGVIAARCGDYSTARQHFMRARAEDPKNADLLSDFGYMQYLQRELSQAEATLREALACNPQHKRAHNTLGQVLSESGRYEESLVAFRGAVGDAKALSNLASAQLHMGKVNEAEKNFQLALQLDRDLHSANQGLTQVANLQRDRRPPVPPQTAPKTRLVETPPLPQADPLTDLAASAAPVPEEQLYPTTESSVVQPVSHQTTKTAASPRVQAEQDILLEQVATPSKPLHLELKPRPRVPAELVEDLWYEPESKDE